LRRRLDPIRINSAASITKNREESSVMSEATTSQLPLQALMQSN
jgi:hypothetical protein